MSVRPLLLLDVDGPLNPYGAKPERRPEGYTTHRPYGLRVWLNPSHGAKLQSLPFDLVWATTWGDDANTRIAPVLGLPELPVIDWPDDTDRADLYYKTPTVVEWAAGRPFAWVDDEITSNDRDYVEHHHSGDALLHYVAPNKGLLPSDFAVLAEWAENLPHQ